MVTRVNGTAGAEDGGIYSPGMSTAFYIITVKNAGGSARNLISESEVNETIELVMREVPGAMIWDIANASTGIIYVITEGHAALTTADLQARIRALGTSVGANSVDVSGTTVDAGAGFTVSAVAV